MALSVVLKSIREWFAETVVGRVFGTQKKQDDNRPSEEHAPVDLPDDLYHELAQDIHCLRPHSSLYRAIADALEDALQRWEHHPEASNSLVILGSPSDELNAFVHISLDEWLSQNRPLGSKDTGQSRGDRPRQPYPRIPLCPNWHHRPEDYQTIGSQLESALQQIESSPTDPLANRAGAEAGFPPHQSIVLVPLLDWCFLRCVDGFDGIERLQNQVLGDRTRFWVLGCNTWAWQYLDQVCQISAYFQQKIVLPPLSSYAIKEWLAPVIDQIHLDVTSDDGEEAKQLQLQVEGQDTDPDNWFSSQERYCFEKLASRSRGLSSVAADLWLRSLSLTPEEEFSGGTDGTNTSNHLASGSVSAPDGDRNHCQESQSSSAPSHSTQPNSGGETAEASQELSSHPREQPWLKQNIPALPGLPSLTKSERYILYSVLLHGHISVSHLALTLGDGESRVQAQVQALLRAGLVNRQHDRVRVDPSYYLSIRADLERNNFLVGEPS